MDIVVPPRTGHPALVLMGCLLLTLAVRAQAQTLAPPGRPVASDEASIYLRDCPNTSTEHRNWCEFNRSAFQREYAAAKKNDFDAQRNIAFLLGGGIKQEDVNPVVVNSLQACAWRNVILRSGQARVSVSDTRNMEIDCGKLGVSISAVNARVAVILRETGSITAQSAGARQAGWIELKANQSTLSRQAGRLPLAQPQTGAGSIVETSPLFNSERFAR